MRFSNGLAPYVACAKLYTFPLVSACSQPPWAIKTPSKLRSTLRHFPNTCFLLFWGAVGGYGSMAPQWGHGYGFLAACRGHNACCRCLLVGRRSVRNASSHRTPCLCDDNTVLSFQDCTKASVRSVSSTVAASNNFI